jgi:methionyl-tRNA formyltransferase
MIKNNNFFIKKIDSVVFLGYENIHEEFKKINKSLNIKSFIISAKKKFKTDRKVYYYPKQKIDNSFKKLIFKICNPNNTLFVSYTSRWIFNKANIDNIFAGNIINFHNSRLPTEAGGGGYSWRIMKNDRIFNLLAHVIDEKIDTGPIISEKTSIFPSFCKVPEDFDSHESKYLKEFYKEILVALKNKKKFILKHQQKSLRRYNPRINSNINGWIDWDMSSHDLVNFIDSFGNPYIGASTYIKKKQRVFIKEVHLHGAELPNHPFMSGIIYRKQNNWIVVSTKDSNSLIIEKVLDNKGKNIIEKLKEGDRFYTTPDKKFISRSMRIKYVLKN